jgi:hypothetical protein
MVSPCPPRKQRDRPFSEVEGVKITPGMKKREADRKDLSAEQRRQSIIDAHLKD